jgi:UDP-N-acetylglucosamine 1-carboxyvinyltransferase
MDKLQVSRSSGLNGTIAVSGAKNAALPIICASLLTSDEMYLKNIPHLDDMQTLGKLLAGLGVSVTHGKHSMRLCAANLTAFHANEKLAQAIRASILLLGPLLSRFGEVELSLPGGDAIGARPVDQHIRGLELMGAEITIKHGYIIGRARKLHGAKIVMDMVTVTGTENLLMAATLARGTTVLENCAREPEVTDLANCLVKMGAKIEGIGTDRLVVYGVERLHGVEYSIIPDRIEAGTYAVGAIMAQGDVTLTDLCPDMMGAVINKLTTTGANITVGENWLRIIMDKRPRAVDIRTSPYPAFPTDMQAQFMALNCVAEGYSRITETIWENRYMHVSQLRRMGADIEIESGVAVVKGVPELSGANVMSTDLRASVSLVLAGMVANGNTIVDGVYHLDRGYERIEHKLGQVGVNIKRLCPTL